jgi:DNA polymerase-3 subunit gamma/tau
MGQALYRKHRPKKLSEVIGQEHITQTLTEALKQGRISHAYLFTGPRGVGKTSIARILAHEINRLPYTDDNSHIDIIEIDAASNRRIDEIRELREKVHVAPASATYKVYIIDEVHMLTREAFNALLKTLEEPPAHAVFILATTDAHKLPDTIISRTQRFSFKPVSKGEVAAHLAVIAKEEKLKVSQEALVLLAEHGEGSFRDSISLLDQATSHGKKVEIDDVRQLLGMPPSETIQQLFRSLAHAAPATIVTQLTALYDQGYQAPAIAKQLGQLIRSQLIEGQLSIPSEQALSLLGRLLEVPAARDPERLMEIILLENLPVIPAQRATTKPPAAAEAVVVKPAKQALPKEDDPAPRLEVEQVPESSKKKSISEISAPAELLDDTLWTAVLVALKQKHNTLYGVVRMARPTFPADDTVKLAFAFAFHQKRLGEAANRQKLTDTIQEATGRQVTVECVLDESATPAVPTITKPTPPPAADNDSGELAAISNIFGGGELLES